MQVELFGWLAFFEISDYFRKLSGVDCDVAFMAVEIRNHVEELLVYLLAIAASADKFGKKRFKRALGGVNACSLPVSVETPDFLINKVIVEELYNKMSTSGREDINHNNRIGKWANYSKLSKAQGFDAVKINTMEIANSKRLKETLKRNLVEKLDMLDFCAAECSKLIVEALGLSLRVIDISNDMHMALHLENDLRFVELIYKELLVSEKLLPLINRLVPILEKYGGLGSWYFRSEENRNMTF
ncbi:MAG TPA: hypothetical protein PLI88_08445 [Bacillota bacterium]|nr:hypothetical protein [Bacillota bacterium]HOH09965.1 hypothetical protein [Bacillota bacterium]HPI02150.1 hypothetical protein [Bacillota bacterium]HPM63338.1 hypothetical protein [Bacillota bacterium]